MRSLVTIFHYIKRYPGLVGLYFLFNILSAVFSLFSLVMLAPFLQVIFKQGDGSSIITSRFDFWPISSLFDWLTKQVATEQGSITALGAICLIVVIAIIFKNLFAYLALYVLNPIRNSIINDMRRDMFTKIFRLPVGYFNEQRKGDLMSRLTNDLGVIEYSTVSFLEVLFREPIAIIILIFGMIKLSPELSLFLLVFLPIMGFIIGRVGRSLKKMSTRVQDKLGYILSIIDETIGGIRVLKAFNAEPLQSKKFAEENRKLFHIKNRANRRRDLGSPVSETLGVLAVCCVLWYGGRLVLGPDNTYNLSAGDFLTFIVIFTQIITPLKMISQASYNIRNGAASIERIQYLLKEQETIKDIPQPVTLSSFNSSIEFKSISFAYGDTVILDNIDLKINKGKTVALVGSSGAGKSTLADLVPRFHDVTAGELLIDGINIKNYSLESLRSQMSIVTQEAILFNDSISSNIKLGKPDATDEEVMAAAKVANAHNFIVQKENGYETNIGDRGNKLSGGERQRLTIARAVLKNPPILILDEATSSLDTESERLVQDAINNMMQNRTSIVIAHRLSTIRHADEIIVLQKGKIVERGTHDQLILSNGFYRRLVEMQEVK